MLGLTWFFQVALALAAASPGLEFLPEKFLQPRDFNYHPFTDVGIPAALKKGKISNPYAVLSALRPREGRQFPAQSRVHYPRPHPSVLPKKSIEINEIKKYNDRFSSVPKNYAFSYIVKDHTSGDDFSHSQAHNGKATSGQYRVKLPDGRTQIVKYTADHKGYRADVQYEEDSVKRPIYQNIADPEAKIQGDLPHFYQNYPTEYVINYEAVQKLQPTYSPESQKFLQSTISSLEYTPESSALGLLVNSGVKPTVAPLYYNPGYSSLDPYAQQSFVSSTPSPQHLSQQYVSSTPLYQVNHGSTPATPIYEPYQEYQPVSSTAAPQQHAVVVTPRPIYSQSTPAANEHPSVLYRLY